MQDVKHFINGKDPRGAYYNTDDLDTQINAFLKENPNYSIRSLSTIIGPAYKEAFVVFDVREERNDRNEHSDRPQKSTNKQFNGGKQS